MAATVTDESAIRANVVAQKLPHFLESGDRYDQPTFHQIYLDTPKKFRAELVKGVVYVASPVHRTHASFHGLITTLIGVYSIQTPGTELVDNGTTIIDEQNEYQPDCALHVKPEYGGQSSIDSRDCGVGMPELIVEISSSSASYDLYDKFEVYEQAGVQEYVVLLLKEKEVRWWIRESDKLVAHAADKDGVFHSKTFPGLRLNGPALLNQNGKEILATLQAGLETEEHKQFAEQLAKQKKQETK